MKMPFRDTTDPGWIGLFSHIDSVSRGTLDLLLQLKGMKITEHGKEYFVDKTQFKTIRTLMKTRETRVGGNAGNAAFFLGNLGIECVLSAPKRPKELMGFFDRLPVFFWGIRKKRAKSAVKDDPVHEHIVIELFPPLSNSKRTVISWDPVTVEGQLDVGFWKKMQSGLFFLSGLHLIEKKSSVDVIIDKLKDRKVRTYLEIGEPTKVMKYAVKKLSDEELINHIGMNEREAKAIFGAEPDEANKVSKETSCGVTIHTLDYVSSTNTKMLRPLIDIIESWAMGNLLYYKQVITLPLKRAPKGAVPTRSLPFMEKTAGLGDSTGVLDMIRIFDPKKMEKLVKVMPFYGTDKFPTRL